MKIKACASARRLFSYDEDDDFKIHFSLSNLVANKRSLSNLDGF